MSLAPTRHNGMKKNKEKLEFPGLPDGWENNFWKYPRILEGYWCILTGSEQKVLDFIMRQCIGFKNKKYDKISLSQFQNGIGKNNKGTGLSRGSIITAIRGLVDKKFIWVERAEYQTSKYGLVVQELDKSGLKSGQESGSNSGSETGANSEQTIENNNNNKNKIIEKEIDALFSYYQKQICPGARLGTRGREAIARALQEFEVKELVNGIYKFSQSNWHMRHHAGRGVLWFFKDEDQIDKWINLPREDEDWDD